MAKQTGTAISRVFKMVKDLGIKMVDFKFMDFPGQWQHFSVPVGQLKESSFEEGFGFDGSSIRGWKAINESDMLIIPDPKTALLDRFIEVPTLRGSGLLTKSAWPMLDSRSSTFRIKPISRWFPVTVVWS